MLSHKTFIKIDSSLRSSVKVLEFLDGLCTQCLARLKQDHPAHTLFLNTRGRVLADALVHLTPRENIIVECDESQSSSLVQHLRKFAEYATIPLDIGIASDMTVGVYSKKSELEEIPYLKNILQSLLLFRKTDALPQTRPDFSFAARDPRAPLSHIHRIYFNKDETPSSRYEEKDLVGLKASAYRSLRHMEGIAEGSEIQYERALPTEFNFDLLGSISYTKGCYLGQELTARSHFSGIIRRRVVPFYVPHPIAETQINGSISEAISLLDSEGKAIGKVIAFHKQWGLASCTCHPLFQRELNDVEINASLCATWQGYLPCRLQYTESQTQSKTKCYLYIPYWWPDDR